jgi:RNA polymerase II-associated protein 3
MCKSSLDPALLMSIIDVFIEGVKANAGDRVTADAVRAYLTGFETVPRFGTVLLFLSEQEKARVREIWKLLGVQTLGGAWSSLGQSVKGAG